jgi:hypothetical protein
MKYYLKRGIATIHSENPKILKILIPVGRKWGNKGELKYIN